jgi:sulfite exporter TauE/SafE
VYSVLLLAAASSRPVDGALVMLAFGIGTMPAMVTTGMGALKVSQFLRRRRARLGFGLLVVVLGVLTLAMPTLGLLSTGAHHH